MQAWITRDADGSEVLVRSGTGRVTAVLAVGEADEPALMYRVEIECDSPRGRVRSIRYTAHALIPAHDPRAVVAMEAERSGEQMQWAIEWHRHAWVPAALPVSSLDLATDARACLVELAPARVDTDASLGSQARAERG